MALTFRLATVTLCKMGALLEKLVDVESGAKSYVKLILGWVQSIRALQARQGEPEKNWISIYDFVVFMVDNCPENIGAAGGVCVLLEAQRRLAYDEMACSGVRGDQLGNYVVSEVANCGLHIVNTFSANYNRTWKAVEESFINEGVDKASRDSDGDDTPESFDPSLVDGGGVGGGGGGGGGPPRGGGGGRRGGGVFWLVFCVCFLFLWCGGGGVSGGLAGKRGGGGAL